jgi:hypothetical protein
MGPEGAADRFVGAATRFLGVAFSAVPLGFERSLRAVVMLGSSLRDVAPPRAAEASMLAQKSGGVRQEHLERPA